MGDDGMELYSKLFLALNDCFFKKLNKITQIKFELVENYVNLRAEYLNRFNGAY